MAVGASVALNPWAMSSLADLWWDSLPGGFSAAVSIIDALLIILAIYLLFRERNFQTAARSGLAVLLGVVLAGGIYANALLLGLAPSPLPDRSQQIDAMLASEELILRGTPELRRLATSVLNLQFPDHRSLGLFADQVGWNDLASQSNSSVVDAVAHLSMTTRVWSVSNSRMGTPRDELAMWRSYLATVDYFDHAKFFFVDGDYLRPDQEDWESQIGFGGLARLRNGKWSAIRASQQVTWRRVGEGDQGLEGWRIQDWKLQEFSTIESDNLFFEEVLDRAVHDPRVLERARTSLHEELVAEFLFDFQKPLIERRFRPPHRYFRGPAQDRHPAVVVVDFDRDGYDDFYVMARWGKNMFFRNRGDGTFDEIAGRLGIDIDGRSSAAIFADFDNDGDDDLLLGRTLERSQYFERVGARFVDRSEEAVGTALPYLVSSVAAADYDGDGLLDLYISTYASDATRADYDAGMGPTSGLRVGGKKARGAPLLSEFLTFEDADWLEILMASPRYDHHVFRNSYGPPNILLKNMGNGRFQEPREIKELRVFRHTYQSTWGDYDNDGDPDLYLANDFAKNNFFRNDGSGHFVDVTAETGTADIGFGMGVSWGDYDQDSRQDLYISNMFSKAGKRITGKVSGINPVFKAMAEGNSLFRNEGESFTKVSGTDEGTILVEKAGWSWGSQFLDFDNDGWLDLYALSGHYTAPHVIESQVDL